MRFLNIQYFFEKAYAILTGTGDFVAFSDASILARIAYLWKSSLPYLEIISTYLSLIFLTLLVYTYIRLRQVIVEDKKKFDDHYVPTEGEFSKSKRWEKIITLANSENPSDWRQAVIEADVILDEIVTAQGFRGESLGEKMKGIEKSDFNTLNQAWDAHKVRNRIAHEGGNFILTQREVKRVIGLYEQVFKEFQYI
ncbi:MAG: hypothetical protein QF748_02260 [Candidatus Pacebacteria bacterium]|nr:hypothetical protein [Candidatus Paceibacterota bacterium]